MVSNHKSLSRRQWWKLFPRPAIKCAAISLAVVLAGLFSMDLVVLPVLERRGLTSGDSWARHNAVVVAEHQLADRTEGFPEPLPSAVPAGIRSWVGHPVGARKSAGTKRILVMGDSFVWGSPYLTLNHMWWRQLGLLLENESVEVVSLGRPGASTHDQLTWARHFVPECQPDLIIWGYVSNDADEGLVRQISTSQQSIPKLDRVRGLARRIWPRVTAKFDALRNSKLAKMFTGPEYGYEYSDWELKLVDSDNLAAYRKTVRDVKSFLDETGIPGFMMTLPNFPSTEYFKPRIDPIMSVWQDAGIAAYDTVPEFVRRFGEMPLAGSEAIQWGINPADGHPGPRSCRFLAEQAAEIIHRDFSQVPGETSKRTPDPVLNDWLPNLEPEDAPRFDASRRSWTMKFPVNESRWPTMPLGIPTIVLAFERPVSLSSLELSGQALKSAQVWVTCLDANEQFDDGIQHDLGERSGKTLSWSIPADIAGRPASVIYVRATFSTDDRTVNWMFHPSQKGAG